MKQDTYKTAYLYLYGKITDEIQRLQEIQQGVEEIFLNSDEFDAEIEAGDADFAAHFVKKEKNYQGS